MKAIICLLLTFFCLVSSDETRPVVSVKPGKLQGVSVRNSNGFKYFAFRGIPFAKPPTGSLRFQLPEAAESWEGVRDASKEGNECWQFESFQSKIVGDEDCLNLNVFTPEVKRADEGGKPVMVWIHGGAFSMGSSSEFLYGAGLLVEQDVVVVTINYRLNLFGFLSTDDESATGNYGMWDQVAALQWVQDNIREFGGDPGKVTIFGESAGGGSVGLLVASPAAKGLFHGAIAQSGSSACHWSTQEENLHLAKTIAESVDCPTDCTKKLVKCLREKDGKELFNAYVQTMVIPHQEQALFFAPVVDSKAERSFMPELPISLLKKGEFNKVPVIAGMNENEGGLFYTVLQRSGTTIDEDFITNKLDGWLDFSLKVRGVTDQVKKEYLEKADVTNQEVRNKIIQEIYGDALFVYCQQSFVKTISEHGVPAYLYLFSYPSAHASFTKLFNSTEKLGVVHADELLYLFESQIPFKIGEEDKETRQRLVTLWTNFAKTRIPTPDTTDLIPIKWNPLNPSSNEVTCLNINKDLSIVDGYRKDKTNFWINLLTKRPEKKVSKDEL